MMKGLKSAPRANALDEQMSFNNILDSERGFLGYIIKFPEDLSNDIIKNLHSWHFSNDLHSLIYETILDMKDFGKTISFDTIRSALEGVPRYEDAGGRANFPVLSERGILRFDFREDAKLIQRHGIWIRENGIKDFIDEQLRNKEELARSEFAKPLNIKAVTRYLTGIGVESGADCDEIVTLIKSKLPKKLVDKPLYKDRKNYPALSGTNIVEWLRLVWWEEMSAGLLSRPALRKADPSASMALDNWMRTRSLPADINLPTKSDLVAAHPSMTAEGIREARRVLRAAERKHVRRPTT